VIDPTGPLPPGVYWRRRIFAVVASVVAVVLLAWIIGQLVNGSDSSPVQGASVRSSQPPSSSRPPEDPSSLASPSASTEPVPVPVVATPVPPPPPQPCPDTTITVLAETDAPTFRVGARPQLRLVIANAGPAACYRDVSRGLRELIITSIDGAKRLWSSNDCYSPPGADTRLIQPGERLTFTVNWAGRTSAPGCPTRRRTVTAGSYLLVGKLGPVGGPPIPLTIS
jgi:hypothetical protein